jgi:hypothetical protein
MACLPFYNVVTTRGENWLLEGVTVLFFACTYCYLAWGLVWSTGCSLVGASFFRFFLSRTSRAEPSRAETRQDKTRHDFIISRRLAGVRVCAGGWMLYGIGQIPSMLREYGWSKSDGDGDAPSPAATPVSQSLIAKTSHPPLLAAVF